MSDSVSASPEPVALSMAAEDCDVLSLCEIWLALDFPDPTAVTTAAPPHPEEAL